MDTSNMTNQSKHTPGPWHVADYDRNDQRQIESEDGSLVAVITHTCLLSRLPEMESNANLIATAPELLEALKNLMEAIAPELTGIPKNVSKSTWGNQWDNAETIIAKAEGGK